MSQVEVEGKRHKSRGGRLVSAEAFDRWLTYNKLERGFDPTSEGGFIVQSETEIPRGFVKSPLWRTEKNSPRFRKSDILPVFLYPKEHTDYGSVESGGELELFVWDPVKKEMAPVMASDSLVPERLIKMNNDTHFVEEDPLSDTLPKDAKEINFSSELATSCLELNFHHSTDSQERALAMVTALKKVATAVSEDGWNLLPIAIFPHRPLTPEDTNQDPYVQRMAMEYIGWDTVRHFLGASWQVHVEMLDLESGVRAANLLQQVSPLLYGISLAGPFAHGKVNPVLTELYGGKRVREIQKSTLLAHAFQDEETGWHSLRYPSRWYGSPAGGVFTEPLPETMEKFLSRAERGLRENDERSPHNIPNPSRLAGHHRDRVRIDIAPNGTVEVAAMDTFGGHVLKLAAVQEFTKALIWRLQVLSKNDGFLSYLDKNPQYKSLFSYPISKRSLGESEINSFLVSKYGVGTLLIGQDQRMHRADKLFELFIKFVQEPIVQNGEIAYSGLPKSIVEEMRKSSMIPNEIVFDQYRDQDGHPSVLGFYETGIGTLSCWLKRRADELVRLGGYTEQDAVRNCMDDLAESYHSFLTFLKPAQVTELFA